MPNSGRFEAGLSKDEFIRQMSENGWITENERKLVGSVYDILANDPLRGFMLDRFLDEDLWSTQENYRQSKLNDFLIDLREEELVTGPLLNTIRDFQRNNGDVIVPKEVVTEEHKKIMGYPIEERTHRLAEEQRAKGKPTISRYLTKEEFLDRAAELGWVFDDDQYFLGTLYDTFADDPENVNVLMSFTRSDAWSDFGRKLCINGLEKGLSSESITDEQREKINEALNRNDWKNTEFDDDALSDIFEDRYGVRYESFEGVIDPFNRPYNKILTDARVYKTLIDADIAEQKELARKNSFANDYTKNDFIEGYRRKGWIADADDDFFGTVYDELSEVPDGKALLIDMMNIPAWDVATQKKLKNMFANRTKEHIKQKGGNVDAFQQVGEKWIADEPDQEKIDQLYQYLYEKDRNEQIKGFDENYSFSKDEFLNKAFENGWELPSDKKLLGTLYDYTYENHNIELGELLKVIMETDVGTYDARREMCDAINKMIDDYVPKIIKGGFFTDTYCKLAKALHVAAEEDMFAVNDHEYFDVKLPASRQKRIDEAQFKEFRGKIAANGWNGSFDKSFAKFLFGAKKFISGNEKYANNEELVNAIEKAEKSDPSGRFSNYNKGEVFNELVDVFEKQGLMNDPEFDDTKSFGIEFSENLEKAYNESKKEYLKEKEKLEREQREKEEEERSIEEQRKKLEESQIKRYTVKNDIDDDFIVEGDEVIEYLNDSYDDFYVENDPLTENGSSVKSEESTGKKTDDAQNSEVKNEGVIPPAEAENKDAPEKPEIKNEEKAPQTETKNNNVSDKAAEEKKLDDRINANGTEIKVLIDIKKQLDTTHRFGVGHEDSQAIINLRKSLQDLIDIRQKHLTRIADEQPDILEATERVYLASRAYIKKIREEAHVADTNRKWKPTSKMGRERYGGAQVLEDITGRALGFEAMGELFPDAADTAEPEIVQRTGSLVEIADYDPRQKGGVHANKYLEKTMDNIRSEFENSKNLPDAQGANDKPAINSTEHKKDVVKRLISKAVAAHSAAEWEKNYIENGGKPLSQAAFNEFTDKIARTLPNHKAFKAYVKDLSATELLERALQDDGKSLYAGVISSNQKVKKQNNVKPPRTVKSKTTDDLTNANVLSEQIKRVNTIN